jgi:hypothetical protein
MAIAKNRLASARLRLTALRLAREEDQKKKAEEARNAADAAYHYTFSQTVESIRREGLRPGSFATPNGGLSPLQAQIDLALSPNGLRNAVLRIDLDGLRRAGYKIPEVTPVARSQNMPGGGYEMKFPYAIPPQFIQIVER